MDRESVRLEILKLVNRHDHGPENLILRAKALEEYILGDSQSSQSITDHKASVKPKKSGSKEKSDTTDILS